MSEAHQHALDEISRLREQVGAMLPEGSHPVDAHTHLGLDEDGRSLSLEEMLASMDLNGVERSVTFALNAPDRVPAYRVPNNRVLGWVASADNRLVPFVRLSLDEEPLVEAERCVALGARGIKLHPRAQQFRVSDPRLEDVFAFAAEHRLPVLIHAGRGLPAGMAEELAHISDRHPEASLILAHAAIAEQGRIGELANGHPNIFFDTSTWTPLDLMALFAKVGPEQVLWASDIPYGDQMISQHMVLRLMRWLGLSDDIIRGVMGGTVAGLVEGRRPERISAPAAPPVLDVSYDRARVHTYLSAATPLLWLGQIDAIGFLGLAAAACHDHGSLDDAARLIGVAEKAWSGVPEVVEPKQVEERTRAVFKLLHCAQVMALYG
jgi:predicted TIM-barrel fold metal-dependent hydrolase